MATSASEIVTADLLLWSKYLNGWEDNVIGKIFVLYMEIIGANLRAAEIFHTHTSRHASFPHRIIAQPPCQFNTPILVKGS